MATAGEAVLNGQTSDAANGAEVPHKPKTGIKVVIVGAGFGGLCAAIECYRQGHDVELYESFKELKVRCRRGQYLRTARSMD